MTDRNVTDLVIADSLDVFGVAYKTVGIDDAALKGLKKLTTLTIGKNVTTIGKEACSKCKKLKAITIKGTKTTTYLYVGDRWMDPDLPRSKTIIFPIMFKDGKCDFTYRDQFEINFKTGEWREKKM